MRIIVMIAAVAALAACEGTTTGRKSECFGQRSADGTYVATRNATNHFTISASDTPGGRYDCDYQSF